MTHSRPGLALTVLLLAGPAAVGQDGTDPYALPAGKKVSYTADVKPILDRKCVACHACYDSPAQLNLTTAKGVQRGAYKVDPYALQLDPVTPTRLEFDPKTVADWHKLGFFSVTEGGRDSLMAKIVELGYRNRVTPNARIPAGIELDALKRKVVAPTRAEFDQYAKDHPHEGMPLAVTGLTPPEYAVLMKWLEDGAPFDEVAPQPTAAEAAAVAEWEAFLNGPDDKARLVGRYVYEHLFTAHMTFDMTGGGHFFQMIRSSTPPGRPPVPVAARLACDPVDGAFFYRLAPVEVTLHEKRHILFDAGGDKLARYKQLFAETPWEAGRLPGYTNKEARDPLGTFAAIPAKARWKFLLEDTRFHLSTVVWGPSCRGGFSVNSIRDRFWVLFENPDTSRYVTDAEYRAELAPLVAAIDLADDLVGVLDTRADLVQRRAEAQKRMFSRLGTDGRDLSRLDDLWRGDRKGHSPALSIVRNFDNAYLVDGFVGDVPKTAWVLNLVILERKLYSSVVHWDLFGGVVEKLSSRQDFGLLRRDAEMNYLRFLPADRRQALHADWYRSPRAVGMKSGYRPSDLELDAPTGVTFTTDDPHRELLTRAIGHVGDFVPKADPIGRPADPAALDPLTTALRSIVTAADKPVMFKQFLPEAMFLRIDAPGREPKVYTLTRDSELTNVAFAFAKPQRQQPENDRLTIYPGILTSYPNFIFRVDEADAAAFAAALTAAATPAEFTKVVERWGVRRSHPQFWDIFHSFTDYVRRTNPVKAAVFDLNRYRNL